MNDVLERLGASLFVQTVIACWNELLILFLLVVLLRGVFNDRRNRREKDRVFRMAQEIIVFVIAVLIYNLSIIVSALCTGVETPAAVAMMHCSSFCYFATGEFHSLYLLFLFWKRIISILHDKVLGVLTGGVCLLQLCQIALLISAPFTGKLYRIEAYHVSVQTIGAHLWLSIQILTLLFIGAMLIIHWNKDEGVFCQAMAVAVFIPLLGAIVSFLMGFSMTDALAPVTILAIFTIYMGFKIRSALNNVNELSRMNTLLVESRLSLEQSKNEMLMAQIQPHFINNSLMTIAARCADYPEIYESITNFSLYLRSHFEALGCARTIPFESEMDNIEAYLSLARENYQEKLQVEYNIECDDFLVPALSVQPLVENAVQHGVSMYAQGGTVTIASNRREDGAVVIEVTDEGRGSSSITPQQKKRKGIGVENVRARLRSMSDGELVIIPHENGTTARITLTKCEEVNADDDLICRRSAADHGADAPDADEN